MNTVNHARFFVAAFVLARLVPAQGTVIFEHPKDATVEPNVWANFSCTVQCSLQPVKWYKTGRLNPIEHPTGTNIDGLEFNITSNSMCTSENKITYFLEVLATRQSHNSAFYCAAYENCIGCPETECKCGCVGLCYSRPAILKVETVATTPHPTPTTPQETVLHETTTKTVTITTTVTPTNCPTLPLVAGPTSLQVGTSSSQAASAQAAILLAWLGVVASIFLF